MNSASVATIARMPYVRRLESIDFLYANNEILIWSIVEVGISIIATAMATLRPLLAKSRLFSLITQSSRNRYSTKRVGALTTELSGVSERRATLKSVSGGARNSHRASGRFFQRTSLMSVGQEPRGSKSGSSEEGLWNGEVGQTSVSVRAMESNLELEDLDVPKHGIQRSVKISS